MSLLSLPEVPCLNWKQCSVLTFGLSPGMHAAEGRLSFLCCQKKLLTPHMSFYSLYFISNREQEVFLNMSWRCVTSEGVCYHCKHPIFVKHKILNAASVGLLKLRRASVMSSLNRFIGSYSHCCWDEGFSEHHPCVWLTRRPMWRFFLPHST